MTRIARSSALLALASDASFTPDTFDQVIAGFPARQGGAYRPLILSTMTQLHPDWTIAKSNLGYQAQKDSVSYLNSAQVNQRLTSMDNILKQLDNVIVPLSDKFGRSGVKAINGIYIKSQVQANNQDAIKFESAVNTVREELARAFGGSQEVTDAKLAFATNLLDQNLSPEGFKSQVAIIKQLLSASEQSLTNVQARTLNGQPVSGGQNDQINGFLQGLGY